MKSCARPQPATTYKVMLEAQW